MPKGKEGIMQTFLVHPNYRTSAQSLDNRRLFSQIYESIHILASLVDMNEALVNPKRNVANHPVARLWKGHEASLLAYAYTHYKVWAAKYKPTEETINAKNLEIIRNAAMIGSGECPILDRIPYYKLLLKTKDPEFYHAL